MIINELLLDIFRHSSERVVDTLMILSQVLEGGGDEALQL